MAGINDAMAGVETYQNAFIRPQEIRLANERNQLAKWIAQQEQGNRVNSLNIQQQQVDQQGRQMEMDQQAAYAKQHENELRAFYDNLNDEQIQRVTGMTRQDFAVELARHGISVRSGQDVPSDVLSFESFMAKSPEDRATWLDFRRAGQPVNVGGVPGVVKPGTTTVTPLATVEEVAGNQATIAGAAAGAAETAKTNVKRAAAAPGVEASIAQQTEQIGTVISQIDDVLENANWTTTGIPGIFGSKIPGTPAYDQKQIVESIKANIGFDRLQAMRNASPTGGALGQVAVQELEALRASIASLDEGQSLPQFRKNLKAVKRHYQNWEDTMTKSQRAKTLPLGQPTQPPTATQPPTEDPLGLLNNG